MLKSAVEQKRCIMVCGGGGVGKTTVAASLALAAARVRPRVLVVTIDPSKRLLQAFGFDSALAMEGGAPLKLSDRVKQELGLEPSHDLSVAVLNPKYVLEQILTQVLSKERADRLRSTILYRELSQMIYGLQEYTAYEWVTRMISNNEYDLIVLDTPPAFHAKDFFNAPDRIKKLMESRVFQIFLPKKKVWFSSLISFGWVEKLLGANTFSESKIFFETFVALRDRILERCDLLSEFFVKQEVSVIAVGTPETTAQLELEGLTSFLKEKNIPLESIIINQVEERASGHGAASDLEGVLTPPVLSKIKEMERHQEGRSDRAAEQVSKIRAKYSQNEVITIPMSYAKDGFEILRSNAERL